MNEPGANRWLVVLLFAASGCAALIYEVTWFQLLELVIGSTAVSLAFLLTAFMGGMCLGAFLAPRAVPRRYNPLCVFASMEACLGICGVTIVTVLPSFAHLYAAHAGANVAGLVLRGLLCMLCLLPPTMLMGATLPVLSRWSGSNREGWFWLGLLYTGNTVGAVFGSLFAGYYLLRTHGMAFGCYTAAGINGVIALTAFLWPSAARSAGSEPGLPTAAASPSSSSLAVYITIAISGACALAAEVVWTRLLALMLGATTYAFSLILAVFLTGLALGSGMGCFWGRIVHRPAVALACCQLSLTAGIGWAAYMLSSSLPYWPINPSLSSSLWYNFQLDLVRCAWALLPPALFWGASFPLAIAAAGSPGEPARSVSAVYAANTAGAIVGALGGGVLLTSWLGTQTVERLLIVLTAAGAGLLWVVFSFRPARVSLRMVMLGLPLVGALGLLVWKVPALPWELVAYGRHLPINTRHEFLLYMGEGMNASVAVTEMPSGVRNFHISGKVEASTDPRDMRMQRMLGHLPALVHPGVKSVLVVGCGAGVTAGTFVLYPGVKRIVICELEPLIPRLVAPFFGEENYDVVSDPRVTIIYDDARHYLLTSRETFDVITSDPIHPWVKGAASLYTEEYFELCRRHLNPGGMVTQWVPLYESSREVVQCELATFFAAFPQGTIWSNDENGAGYDLVLMGQSQATPIELDQLENRFISEEYEPVRQSLKGVGFRSSLALMATYAGRASELQPWLKKAVLNRDAELRLQYLAGQGLDVYQEETIFSEIKNYRTFPSDFFLGSAYRRETLLRLLEGPGRTFLGH